MDKDSPAKRLVIVAEETMESDHEAEANEPEETSEMQFEDDAGPPDAGGAGSSDSMTGISLGLNIVGITEVFFPPEGRQAGEATWNQVRVQHGRAGGMELRAEGRPGPSNHDDQGGQAYAGHRVAAVHLCFHAARAEQIQPAAR